MTKEEKIQYLTDAFLAENEGYCSIQEPVTLQEKRMLLRSLMNVRWPKEASEEILRIQDELLKEEVADRGIVNIQELPVVNTEYPCTRIKNADRIVLWRGDITRLDADAIVNAAQEQLLGCFVPCHGCIDNVIHSAAGIQLRNECAQLMNAQGKEESIGKAKITRGYNLPAKHVIHTVGPVVGNVVTKKQEEQLASCYRSCLKLAERNSLTSIALCCISTGEFHFPNKLAAAIAIDIIDRYLTTSSLEKVIINVFKEEDYNIYRKLLL